jgi:SAM-dependent methyltransferase
MNCPVCGSPRTLAEREVPDYVLHRCTACDVGFAAPMRAATAEWYAQSPLYLNVKALHVPLGWHHLRFLEHAGAGAGRRLLDVGCGTGTFLDRARAAGFEPAGLDFDPGNVEIARTRYGLTAVETASIDTLAARAPGQYDVVTLFEVVEHVEDPRALLRTVRTLLRPGGLLAFSMPNRDRRLDSLREGDWPPNHLTRWTRRSVLVLLDSQGFEPVAVEAKPFDADEIVGFLRARLRLGVARRMLAQGAAAGDPGEVRRAARLMRVKDALLHAVARPLAPLARALGWQGGGLLVIGRPRR